MDRLQLVLVSDLHGWLPQDLPGGDLLILAGDFCPIKKHSLEHQTLWVKDEFSPWLKTMPYGDIVAIGGNHDFIAQRKPEILKDLPWHYLQDQSVHLGGLHIWGSPWAPPCGNWAFMKKEAELETVWQAMPEDVDLLITHTPAAGLGDRVLSGQAVGSSGLRSRILQTQPALHVCGHIHEARGHGRLGKDCCSVNASLLDETYHPWGWCYTATMTRQEGGWQMAELNEHPLDTKGYQFR